MNSKIHIVTIATHNKGYLDTLAEGCAKGGLKLNILGMGEKWQGFAWKFRQLREFIKPLNDNDIVIFVDGYDTLCIDNIDNIYKRFIDSNTNILVSTDSIPKSLLHKYLVHKVFNKCKKVSINTGMYMGYVKYLKELLDRVCARYDCNDTKLDDQRVFTEFCNSNNDFFNNNVKIDTDNKVFLNIGPDTLFSTNASFDKVFANNGPAFVQGPGNTNLDPLVDLFKFENKGKRRDEKGYIQNALNIYYSYFKLEIIAIVLVAIFLIYTNKSIYLLYFAIFLIFLSLPIF